MSESKLNYALEIKECAEKHYSNMQKELMPLVKKEWMEHPYIKNIEDAMGLLLEAAYLPLAEQENTLSETTGYAIQIGNRLLNRMYDVIGTTSDIDSDEPSFAEELAPIYQKQLHGQMAIIFDFPLLHRIKHSDKVISSMPTSYKRAIETSFKKAVKPVEQKFKNAYIVYEFYFDGSSAAVRDCDNTETKELTNLIASHFIEGGDDYRSMREILISKKGTHTHTVAYIVPYEEIGTFLAEIGS